MKSVGDSGRGEYDAARLHSALLVTNANLGSAADDIVDLVLLVRLLRIHAASRKDIQAEAERGRPEEFKIELAGLCALPVEVGEFEGVHGVATLANPASWSQGSPLFSWTSRSTSPNRSGMGSTSTSAAGTGQEAGSSRLDGLPLQDRTGEPPRLCRRLHDLRGWSHGTTE